MKADLTRNTFDPLKRYTSVLMQQGRVQVDADWNEQAAILLRYIRALAADLVGPTGKPQYNAGFSLTEIGSGSTEDYAISPGHYYVDGILCETGSSPIPGTVITQSSATIEIEVSALAVDGAALQPQSYVEITDGNQAVITQVTSVGTSGGQLTVTLTALGSNPPTLTETSVQLRIVSTYLTQPDYPIVNSIPSITPNTQYEFYLDVWERLVTYVEDDSIREVALGGAETAARTKLVCQVKTLPPQAAPPSPSSDLRAQIENGPRGSLKAIAAQQSTSTDPCVISPQASYRGPENQLYRVEIHNPGAAGTATFKWSRENGSVVFPILSFSVTTGNAPTTTVMLESLGRDDRFGLSEGDYVEIQNDDYVLQNLYTGTLLQVQSIATSPLRVTLQGAPPPYLKPDPSKHPLLRRWDQTQGDPAEGGTQLAPDNAIYIVEPTDNSWITLEDGIQIQFQAPSTGSAANSYRTSDYWLIPARTATGNIEWPQTPATSTTPAAPIAKPPDGVTHHYALL
jgi:Family of unknown function (DUF6519)